MQQRSRRGKEYWPALFLLIAFFTAIEIPGTPSVAQSADTLLIDDRVDCRRCRIRLDPGMELTGPDEDGVLSWPAQVVKLKEGFAVWFHDFAREIHVFGDDGRYRRTIGRAGTGPGELSRIRWIHVKPDGLLEVFNGEKVSVLTAEGSEVSRYLVPCCQLTGSIESPNGELIVSAAFRTPKQAGFGIHRLSRDGNIIDSWGEASEAILRTDHALLTTRRLASTRNSLVAVHMIQYAVDEFDWRGRLTRRFVRTAKWFPRALRTRDITMQRGVPPIVQTVLVDNDSLLWIASLVQDRGYRKALRGPFQIEGQGNIWRVTDPMDVWDTVIEVIDLDQAKLLARRRLDGIAVSFTNDAIFVARQDRHGIVRLDMLRLALRR